MNPGTALRLAELHRREISGTLARKGAAALRTTAGELGALRFDRASCRFADGGSSDADGNWGTRDPCRDRPGGRSGRVRHEMPGMPRPGSPIGRAIEKLGWALVGVGLRLSLARSRRAGLL